MLHLCNAHWSILAWPESPNYKVIKLAPILFFAEIRDAQFLKRLVLGGPGSIFKLLNFRVFSLIGKNSLGS